MTTVTVPLTRIRRANKTGFIDLGTCRRAGLQVCSEDGLNVTCNAEIIAPAIPAQDLCDYKDDDW